MCGKEKGTNVSVDVVKETTFDGIKGKADDVAMLVREISRGSRVHVTTRDALSRGHESVAEKANVIVDLLALRCETDHQLQLVWLGQVQQLALVGARLDLELPKVHSLLQWKGFLFFSSQS